MLNEFPHANEKQALGALHATREPQSEGKPGWRVVHAARLLPPARLGAPSNPIVLSSSNENSPEQAAAKAERLLVETAMRSKPAWCWALGLSLGVDETFIGQVFDTYKPRSADLLEAFAIRRWQPLKSGVPLVTSTTNPSRERCCYSRLPLFLFLPLPSACFLVALNSQSHLHRQHAPKHSAFSFAFFECCFESRKDSKDKVNLLPPRMSRRALTRASYTRKFKRCARLSKIHFI